MSKNYSSPTAARGNFVWLRNVATFMPTAGASLRGITVAVLTAFCMVLGGYNASAQTTLIDPNTDGGFENGGGGFVANGWTAVNSANNTWQCSAVGTPFAGTNHAFISNDGGATYGYSTTISAANYFYKDITVPAGESIITLNFQLKNVGEAGWDRIAVFAAPTSVIPVAGVPNPNSLVLAGATLVYTDPAANGVYHTSGNITVPSSFAGTTFRLMFLWSSDTSAGTSPGGAVDNISLTSAVPALYTTTTYGGLWSSTATWVGGVVPANGNDILVPVGSTLTMDATRNVRDITIDGDLNWNATVPSTTVNFLTVTRDITISATGRMFAHNAAAAPAGAAVFLARNFTNNGWANFAYSNASVLSSDFNVNPTITGTGTFAGGILHQLFFQTTGTSTISTTNPITIRSFATAAGTLNTNGLLSINNTAQYYGTAENQSVYEIVVTNHGAGYTSAPTVAVAAPPAGTTATAVANFDLASGTVRSITVTVTGSGYRTGSPAVTLTGGGFTTAATAAAVVPLAAAGTANSLTQKSAVAVITGGINITSHQGVGSARTLAGGSGYVSAPTIGFTLPITYLNLVTAGGAGYTTAPTVTVSGGTNINGGTNPTFTVTVASGIVTGVQCTAAGTGSWTTLPTLTLTGGGGAGATCDFPAGCLPTATATVSNGMIDNITITNQGFGYTVAPTTTLVGGGGAGATAPTCSLGLYNLTLGFFTPAPGNAVHPDDAVVPANRRINLLTMNSQFGVQFNSNLEVYATAPLTLTLGAVNMGANTLSFGSLGYAGQAGTTTNFVEGQMVIRTVGGAVTRNVPFQGTLGLNPGTGSLTTGSTITTWTLDHTAAPSGSVNAPATSMTGTRGFRVRTNPGSIYGTNPVMTCGWTAIDGLLSDNPSLFVAQGTGGTTGPWTVRSTSTGTGALPATGNRPTATVAPGPFVGTGDDYLAFATNFVYVPMAYDVTRNTGITYTSIIGAGGETYGTFGAAGTSSDDGTYSALLTGTTFQYGGSAVTSMTVSNNGLVTFNGGTVGGFSNNLAATARQISVFHDDLVSPGYSGVAANAFLAYKTVGLGSGTGTITIEWKNMETFGNPGPNLNFQLILEEGTNNITMNYGVMQGFDGTVPGGGAFTYSYTCGLSNSLVNPVDPQPGMILQQQEENTRNFSPYFGTVASRGANYLSSMPDCYSQIVFTAGAAYTPYVPGSGVPINDDPAGAITITALPAPPADLCGAYFSSKGASATAAPAVFACGAANNNDDDVWFKFNSINSTSTLKVYSTGGGDNQVEVWDAALTTMVGSGCSAGEGLIETVNLTGLSLGVDYYVRVYHKNGGVQATATATVAGGAITSITMANNGSGYHNSAGAGAGANMPRVTILGNGRNAVGTVVTSGTNNGTAGVTSITINQGGAGYTIPPTIKIAPSNAGVTGDFAITVFATPAPPANDDICNATNIVPAFSCTLTPHFTTIAATASPQAACTPNPDDDVWLQFTAIAALDKVQVNSGTGYNAAIEIFSSSDNTCTGTLTSIACVNSTGASGTETWQGGTLVPGNTYFVRIYHTGISAGSGSFSYCITTPPCAELTPQGLAQVLSTSTDITVNWSDDAQVVSYDWELATFGAAQGTSIVQSGNSGNNSIIAITGLTPDTQYTFYVRTNCAGGANNWASISVNTAYCISRATSTADEDIYNVTIGSLNNTSTCLTTGGAGSALNLYSNYTAVSAPALVQGTTYPISITIGSCGGSFTSSAAAYIDLNGDGDLQDAGEQVFLTATSVTSSPAGTVVTGNVTIPVNCAFSGLTRMRVIAVETGVPASITPCSLYTWGETEDYTVDIVAPSACAGAPAVLTVSSDANPACLGSTITLSVPPILACGITYQWEEDNGGGFLPVGTDSPNYTTTFTGATSYRVQVTCSAGPTTTQSTTLAVGVNTDQCVCGAYCNATSTNSCDEYIGNVTFNTINNSSPVCNGHYQNFTGVSTTITAGGSYAITVTNGGNNYAANTVSAFFDWNINTIWNEAGETVVLTSTDGGITFNGMVDVPCTATSGISRMRVRMNFAAAPTPCTNQTWGEAEDYCVNVLPGTACSGTPSAGASVSSLASVCAINAFNLSLSPALSLCGLTYQWERATAVGGPYTAISGATTQNYTTTQGTANYYRCLVTCTNSGLSSTSTPVQVTMNPLYQCLCTSSSTSTADEDIYNVTIAGLNNTSSCATTGGAGSVLNQYSNYTALPATTLGRGTNYNFCVTVGSCGGAFTTGLKVFFDFNQDGDLSDPGEEAYVSSTFTSSVAGTLVSGSISIPVTASLGVTAMRVIAVETTNPAGILGCGTYTWGETEDYAVNIVAAPSNDNWATPQITPYSGSAYPAGNSYNHTLVGSGLSPQANPANVSACGGGADNWYSFVAASTAYRAVCSTTAFDCVLEITDAAGFPIDAENVVVGNGGENIVTGGLLVGQTYKLGVRSFDGSAGAYNLKIQALMQTTCDDGPGVYALCANFKPDWTGANTYTFNFNPTSPTPGVLTSVTAPASTTLSNPALGLRYNGTYDVTIDANYILFHADNTPDNITVLGTALCPISIIAQPDVQVKTEQRCGYPATLLKGSIVYGKPFACGAINYTVSAQQYTACTGGTTVGLPITGTTTGASSSINLTQVNVGGTIQGGGKWYELTWTPNFSYGPGTPCTPQRVFIGGAVMEDDQVGPIVNEERTEIMVEANLYPNPNTGDMVNLNLANIDVDNVFVNITDMNGRIVYTNRYSVDGSLSTIVTFAQPLANGVYNVQFIIGNEILNEKLMVQK
jgi:GEVED domain/Secretion system C-terminal sorting domain